MFGWGRGGEGSDEKENSSNEDTNSSCEKRGGQNRLEGRGQGRVFKTEALMKDGWTNVCRTKTWRSQCGKIRMGIIRDRQIWRRSAKEEDWGGQGRIIGREDSGKHEREKTKDEGGRDKVIGWGGDARRTGERLTRTMLFSRASGSKRGRRFGGREKGGEDKTQTDSRD